MITFQAAQHFRVAAEWDWVGVWVCGWGHISQKKLTYLISFKAWESLCSGGGKERDVYLRNDPMIVDQRPRYLRNVLTAQIEMADILSVLPHCI